MKKRYKILIIILIFTNLICINYINKSIIVDKELYNSYLNMFDTENKSEIEKLREEVLEGMLASQTEEIVKKSNTDQEKAISIARWISSNISNRKNEGRDEYSWYASRSGLCGARARLFVKMCELEGIPAKVFNMYNFGRVGGGHSCAQAYYNDKWHFFDVTYAGVFMDNGEVMSWDEIITNPKRAMENLVIFQETIDRNGSVTEALEDRTKVNNNERMHIAYSEAYLENARSYGFFKENDVKTLFPNINLSQDTNITIGKIDKQFNDVTEDGINKQISEQLGVSLGTGTDTFHTTWELKNLDIDSNYSIKYHVYKSTAKDLKYMANGIDAYIIKGNEYRTLKDGEYSDVWEIQFKPKKENCSIEIKYDFREEQQLLFVDMIEIKKN